MIWTLDVKKFMKNQESDESISKLAMLYYRHRGITDKTTTAQWLFGLADKQYPSYTILKKEIKNALKVKNERSGKINKSRET
jgi:hypothetical protein